MPQEPESESKRLSFSKTKENMVMLNEKLTYELNNGSEDHHDRRTKLAALKKFILAITANTEEWDNNTSYSRVTFWNVLDNTLRKQNYNDEMLGLMYIFAMEFRLTSVNDLSDEFKESLQWIDENIDKFESNTKHKIWYAKNNLMFDIYRERLTNDKFAITKRAIDAYNTVYEFNDYWKGEIKKTTEEINNLTDTLKGTTHALSLKGLGAALLRIRKNKSLEKWLLFSLLIALGLIITSSIAAEIYMHTRGLLKINNTTEIITTFIPAASLIALLVYFFRVTLYNYQSVKTQLIQIDLRYNLCEFIKPYVDFKKETYKIAPESLDSFERMIFSNITVANDKIPSSYDGIEPLITLIKEIRKLDEPRRPS
ncbi:hypothetical protein [Serratia marcescens]|uniref:hypothetical protein n=1 Tax=Serratia marcescens TaxID=615 RepID=UPI00101F9923|nr:hypothetical protein [Serratia marcescens]RZA48604.1 hypothetical protein EVY46_21835 [Serratia marcescens]